MKCTKCGSVFQSPYLFGDSTTYNTAALVNNKVSCPSCKEFFGGNKPNIAFDERDDNGKVIHAEGGEFYKTT